MGSYATPPDWVESDEDAEDAGVELGTLLSGRLADVDIDSVAAVREQREPK